MPKKDNEASKKEDNDVSVLSNTILPYKMASSSSMCYGSLRCFTRKIFKYLAPYLVYKNPYELLAIARIFPQDHPFSVLIFGFSQF